MRLQNIPMQWLLATIGIAWSKQQASWLQINEDEITLQVNHADSLLIVKIWPLNMYMAMPSRDASALVDIKDFTNTTDLNSISEELNKTSTHIQCCLHLNKQVKQGDKIEVTGLLN